MSSFDNYLSCDAMGGEDGCCGCLEWKIDGRVICNECGTEFEVKPKIFKIRQKLRQIIENIIIVVGMPYFIASGIFKALYELYSPKPREKK